MAAVRSLLVGIAAGCLALAGAVGVAPPAGAATPATTLGDVVYANGDLYLVHQVDGSVQRITWQGDANNPSWSPDGRTVAYDHAGDIWVVTPGVGKHRLTFNRAASDPTWSPDGRTIAYSRATTTGHQIFLVPAAGDTSTPLGRAMAGCDATQPTWAADWELAYTCAGKGIAVQWPQSAPLLIVPDSYASEPAFTAGSKHLVYLSRCAPGQCQEVAAWEATARGANRHQIDSPIAQRWTCAEGDICLASVTGSPYGGWAEAGTYSDSGEGGTTTFTCYQGAIDNGNGDIPLTPPSFCITGYAPAFAVRPA